MQHSVNQILRVRMGSSVISEPLRYVSMKLEPLLARITAGSLPIHHMRRHGIGCRCGAADHHSGIGIIHYPYRALDSEGGRSLSGSAHLDSREPLWREHGWGRHDVQIQHQVFQM